MTVARPNPLAPSFLKLLDADPDRFGLCAAVSDALKKIACNEATSEMLVDAIRPLVDRWRQSKAGSNGLALALISLVEENEGWEEGAGVRELLLAGIDPNEAHFLKNGDGSAPLKAAIEQSNARAVEALLAHGARIEEADVRAAAFEAFCSESRVRGKPLTGQDKERQAKARAIAVAAAKKAQGHGARWQAALDANQEPCVLDWAAACESKELIETLMQASDSPLRGEKAPTNAEKIIRRSLSINQTVSEPVLRVFLSHGLLGAAALEIGLAGAMFANNAAAMRLLLDHGAKNTAAMEWGGCDKTQRDNFLISLAPLPRQNMQERAEEGFAVLRALDEARVLREAAQVSAGFEETLPISIGKGAKRRL